MKLAKLNQMIKGWFVGNFEPTLLKTSDVEVGVKEYQKGASEVMHHHRVATEITAIIFGQVRMNGSVYVKGDIILLEPGEHTDFEAREDSCTVVVKYPSVSNDKYLGIKND